MPASTILLFPTSDGGGWRVVNESGEILFECRDQASARQFVRDWAAFHGPCDLRVCGPAAVVMPLKPLKRS
jgi:hypothetical protein